MARKPHTLDPVVKAAFDLAAEQGWNDVALAAVAERAGVPLAELVERFGTRTALLDAYARWVDRRMMDGAVDMAESDRDRLFDVVMRRFEAMSPDRRALRRVLRESGGDPLALACGARRFFPAMALTLETAGISTAGLRGMLRVQALAVLYLAVLRRFLDDDSEDLSQTMAALDAGLRRLEVVAGFRPVRPQAGGQRAEVST